MAMAVEEARRAMENGEVPVGAVMVYGGEVIARAHNRREGFQDPTAHAEMLVLREAARKLGRWRLTGATLYVTLEPCAMCAGALVLARIKRICFGATDPKTGACGSVLNIVGHEPLNHHPEVQGGILEEECGQLVSGFFRQKRNSFNSGF